MSARLHAYSYDYYDAAGNLVGGETFTCRGRVERWGIVTPYVEEMEWSCSGYEIEPGKER